MIAVIFEAIPADGQRDRYLDIAAALVPQLSEMRGFISIERFQSLGDPAKILSLSFWKDEDAVARWRNVEAHRDAQTAGRASIFEGYRLRVAHVARDYGMVERGQVPPDSTRYHLTGAQPS
ncbi:antibiotic biosynthesis monooxygenase family protein [Burkholderia glumae]|uniref:antibiotic biosynthesis monooxygenase family protein n=1 Tax=Burkholderia glumae TaxID=337 RepID=UPI0014642623|nr:antibiotic biosynthesis monooxygenase [Burkholderia glumae]MCM2547258.1 antibiotic biosynthesis monooxygenase [Burkholderia glumae]QJP71076.1 antibiotic biosynthesis monooxygenase [Burkholderia glumae]